MSYSKRDRYKTPIKISHEINKESGTLSSAGSHD